MKKYATAPSSLARFARYYRPHKKLFAADLGCAFLIALVDLAFPMMTKFALERFLPGEHFRLFFVIILLLTLMYLLRTAFSYFVTYWGHTTGAFIEADMRRDLFAHLQRLPCSFYDNHRTGHIMARVTSDLFDVTELAHHGPEDLFISLVILTGSFLLILSFRWEMALLLFLLVPLMLLHIIRSRTKMLRSSGTVKKRTAEINAALESSVSGVRTAKAFAHEAHEARKFHEGNEHFKAAKRAYYQVMARFNSHLELLVHLLNVAVLAAGGVLIMQKKMSLAELITCNLFVAAFLQPIRRMTNFVEQYTTGMAGFSRFVELITTEPDIRDLPGARPLEQIRGDLEYRNVGFSYDPRAPVLEHINLHIPPGSTLALVGPSGSGKTTLCQLLLRFYEVQEGSITIDGQDIRSITLESLRKNIGLVQQETFLFAGTVAENIAYGRLDATMEEIVEAARQAEIHGEILRFPGGYQALVGERGVKLSGGQKQRISIARIFLKNPPILILDEATSALDSATEARIQRSLEALSQGRTTLIIAHRLSTIRHAHRTVVINPAAPKR